MSDFSGSNGHWVDDPDNPFNRMSWTSGGGGLNNPLTEDSNARRASAMTGYDALPRFASLGVAQAAVAAESLAVVGNHVVRTQASGTGSVATGPGAGGSGAGSGTVRTGSAGAGPGAERVATKPRKTKGAPWPTKEGQGPAADFGVHDGFIPMEKPSEQEGRQFPFLMIPWEQNPYVPNADQIEEEWGDTDFLSPGFFVQWATVPAHIRWNIDRAKDKAGREIVKAWDEYVVPALPSGVVGMGYDEWASRQTFLPDPAHW